MKRLEADLVRRALLDSDAEFMEAHQGGQTAYFTVQKVPDVASLVESCRALNLVCSYDLRGFDIRITPGGAV